MIYITGDTHADFSRINKNTIPDWNQMTHDDYLIICGDFGGIWEMKSNITDRERKNLRKINSYPFTTLFVDGNHENFDRLNEYPVVDFCDGKAHKITDNIFHLMRGEYYTIDGHTFWVFGGARSHDISDGILDLDTIPKDKILDTVMEWQYTKRFYRIKGLSWWEQEMPTKEEMVYGKDNLLKHGNKVDYIITHDAPVYVASKMVYGDFKSDELSEFLEDISAETTFKKWFFGHYHKNMEFLTTDNKLYHCLYEDVIKL